VDSEETLVRSLTTVNDELPEHVNILFIQTVEQSDLLYDAVSDMKSLLRDHSSTFAKDSADLGFCDVLQYDTDTGDAHPIKHFPRRPPLSASAVEDEILDGMLSTGVIEPSSSPWASPLCLVKKKEGDVPFLRRLQVGQRRLKKGRVPRS